MLDDVWDVRYAAAVVSALGPRSRLLVTTRDSRIGVALGAAELRLGVLTDAQALTLLAEWADQEAAALPAEARAVAEECGNLPLALAMIGALVRGRADRWAGALERLRNADLDRITLQFPGYGYPDLLKAIQVSIDALPAEARPRYLEFAVFPDDVGVPEAALEVLWGTAGLDRVSTQELVDLLVDRSLAQRSDDGRLTLHDLQVDYVRKQVADLPALHRRLVDGYARRCPDGWASGPDDGYFFSRLVPHLIAAGRADEAQALLLDYDWLLAKLRATDVNALLADYQAVPNGPEERLVESALRASAHVVARDSLQLPTQLYGRLLGSPVAAAMLPVIERAHPKGWLRPLSPMLAPSGGPLLRTITDWAGHVEVLAVTADGRLAISGALHGLAQVWDLETGAQLHDLQRARNAITALAVSPDGRRVIVGTWGIRVFDLATGTEPFPLAGPERLVPVVKFSRDGQQAISCTGAFDLPDMPADGALTVWDMRTGEEVATFTGYAYRSTTLAVGIDGPLVLGVSPRNELEVWDPRAGKRLRAMPHPGVLKTAAMTDDARLAVTGGAGRGSLLRVWDLERGGEMYTLPGHTDTITAIAVTPDGSLAVSASDDKTVRVWDLNRGSEYCTLNGHSDHVRAVAVTPDGRRVVSAASDHTIKVWDPHALSAVTEGHTDKVTAVAGVPDGRRAVSVSADGTLRIWDAHTGARLADWLAHEYGAFVVAALPDGRHALSGGSDGLKLWDLDTGEQGPVLEQMVYPPRRLVVSADGRWAACWTGAGETAIYDLRRLVNMDTFSVHDRKPVMSGVVALLPGGLVISRVGYHALGLWDLESGIGQEVLSGRSFLQTLGMVAITPDGRHVATTSGRQTVVWDVGRRSGPQLLDNRTDYVTAVAITPDGGHVLVAEDDSGITLWDSAWGTVRAVLEGHTDRITQLLVIADGRWAISVSGDSLGTLPGVIADRSLRVWDLELGTQIAGFTGEGLIASVDVMPGGRTIIAGDAAGRVHFLLLAGTELGEGK